MEEWGQCDTSDSKDNKLLCFVHTLSPVKKATNSGRQYFHCTLQTKNKAVRAVCFFPEKHEKFQSSEQSKSPLKLENCKQPEKLRKQELIIRDNTGSIELVLWNEYVDLLEAHKTYILTNLRLKESKHFNTAKSEKFSYEETTAFIQPLVEIEEDVKQLTTSSAFAKIIGFQSATRNLLCASCNKKVTQKAGSKVGSCEGCKLMQKISACKCNWNVRILFETSELKKTRLTIFNNHCLQKLLNLEMSICDLNSTTEDDLVLALLGFESTYKVTYDNIENTVIDIELDKL
ncbi:uncharacterized protein LOC114527766 [Dendronephthya gigantea]|uniref:uncharacterized protein LOC114527766 n=1 Tax=Dendronephthya gigantea TaxID=151771 RepID=UPI00106D513C|nr:uncharacterized protein LOC114527766 [Dendronephthya gigantea]